MSTVTGFSQNQVMNWSAESDLVTINDVDVELKSIFTKQGTSLTWVQEGYNTTQTNIYNITSATGNWDVQNQLGELDYVLTNGDESATFKVTGTSEGVTLLLIINNGENTPDDSYSFQLEIFTNL